MKSFTVTPVLLVVSIVAALHSPLVGQTDLPLGPPEIRQPLIVQPPDLLVEALSVPAQLIAGESTPGRATILNGGGSAAACFSVTITLDQETINRFEDLKLEKAGRLQLDFTMERLTAGTHTLRCTIVPALRFADANPDNDQRESSLQVEPPGPRPDLEISALEVKPARPPRGGSFTVVVTVHNGGNAPARFPAGAEIVSGGGLLFIAGSATHLQAGETRIFRKAGTKAAGAGWTFRVDPQNLIRELNETNNQRALVMTVQ